MCKIYLTGRINVSNLIDYNLKPRAVLNVEETTEWLKFIEDFNTNGGGNFPAKFESPSSLSLMLDSSWTLNPALVGSEEYYEQFNTLNIILTAAQELKFITIPYEMNINFEECGEGWFMWVLTVGGSLRLASHTLDLDTLYETEENTGFEAGLNVLKAAVWNANDLLNNLIFESEILFAKILKDETILERFADSSTREVREGVLGNPNSNDAAKTLASLRNMRK